MKDFAILRIRITDSEIHSIEYKDTLREAETRYHNIITADIGNDQTNYSLAMIFDRHSNKVMSEVHDYRAEKSAFYPLIRIFEKDEEMNNSVQLFNDDPSNPGKAFKDAEKRWYNVISADLSDESVTYNSAILMDNNGSIGDYHKAFEKTAQPEPEPEPTPEPDNE